jgi:hypothetical protein
VLYDQQDVLNALFEEEVSPAEAAEPGGAKDNCLGGYATEAALWVREALIALDWIFSHSFRERKVATSTMTFGQARWRIGLSKPQKE